MKKITLLILLTFFTISGYSQFTPVIVEGFESTTGPEALPGTTWALTTGNWAVFDNAVGTGQRWGINNTVNDPPIVYAGTNAAYINRETMSIGDISEDFLATPLVNIPNNGELRFFTRSFASGNQGTVYQIRVAPATASQTNPAAYTIIQQWTEADLTTTFNIYEEKVVNIPAIYHNQQVYVSFVKVHNQQVAGVAGSGDRWLVDNVAIVEKCADPTNLTFTTLLSTSATLNWANPSGATSWEIEVVPSAGTPTGVGVVYNGTLPYVVTGLLPNTSYKFYVRAICSSGFPSLYVGPSAIFTTSAAPPECGGNFVDSGNTSANYSNSENITTTICPTIPGEQVTVTFTSFATEATWDGLYVYNGNTVTPSQLLPSANGAGNVPGGLAGAYWGTLTGGNLPGPFTSTSADGCLTFVFRSDTSGVFAGWVSNVTCAPPPVCQRPSGLTTTALTSNSVTLGWTNNGLATTWEVLALPCGSPAPTADSTGWLPTATNPYVFTGLTSATCYDLYVRGNCSSTSNGVSLWSGPLSVTTQVAPPECGGNFVDAGGVAANYANNSNVTTTICPTIPGEKVTVTFTLFNTETNWDGLYVYNGNSVTPSQLLPSANGAGNVPGGLAGSYWGNLTGANLPGPFTSTSADGCLTFVFRSDGSFNNPGWVSTITCAPPPACEQPTNLTASGMTTTTVQLGWVSPGTATAWQVIAVPAGSPAPLPTETGWTAAPTNPFVLGGLTPGTAYEYYVRGDCGGAGVSLWSGPVAFSTVPTCPPPTTLTTSTVLSTSVQLNWNSVAPSVSWQVLVLPCGSPAPTASTTGWIDAPTNPFVVTGLSPVTCYDFYVRGFCTDTDLSFWSPVATVTTQVAPPVCGGTYTDAGGPTANYPNGSDSTVTICPPAGQVVTVTFSAFDTETNWDALYVFDGADINAPQIASTNGAGFVPGGLAGGYWGTAIPGPFTASGVDGCLTFRFRSDGSVNRAGWVADVTCGAAPNCPKPTALTATNITTTSALLGWTELNPLVTSWDIIIVPLGSPVPLPTDPGFFTVSANPALITGLNPGTQYTFYVRSNCPVEGESALSNGLNFNTLLANDNCEGAIFAPVNGSAVCQQVTPGSIAGASASPSPAIAPCLGTADDDVWFQFIATNTYLNVALQNVVGTTTNLNFAAYSGQCGTLTQFFCSAANSLSGVLNNLTVGTTYYIRVYSNAATAQSTTFNLCISTPSTCPTASTVCSLTNYANTTGVTSLGAIGCLGSSPNPAYFTIQVATSGPINFLLTQSSTIGGAPNLDVDYAAWGPFTGQEAACTFIGVSAPFAPPGIGVPVTQQTGCSFSAAPTETLNIANAVAGQYYIVLITNFSNQAGYINLTQTNAGATGAGGTLCCPDAFFSYTPTSYCKELGAPNPIAVIAPSSVAGVFSSTIVPGLVFADTATGEIDLQASAPGNYVITNTVAATASCDEKVKSFTINITEPTSATIAYSAPSYCRSITSLQNVTFTGSTGGSYSASPNGGLYIDANTGAINPSLSAPGIYTVTYALPGAGVCVSSNPTTQVEIIASPVIVQPAPVSVCNTYSLPALTVGNYFAASGGVSPLDINTPITATQTVYIYANNNGCSDEKSFTVTINTAPSPTVNVTQTSCLVQTGTIEVTSPIGTSSGLPSNLFISEVTDEDVGSLTYVEIFNGTGSSVDLSNYKLKVFNNGSTTASCDNQLTGILNNNSTFVIAVGSIVNQGGVVPNQVFATCGGVNTDDYIKLTTSANVDVDLWGRTDGTNFTPANQAGYTYRRNNTATVPSLTWNAADWTSIDPQDYTNIGSYALPQSGYQYSLDNGAYQAGTTFASVAPGTHTITVLDLATGCFSVPLTVVIDPVPFTPTVLGFTYPTPVCQNATITMTPTLAAGFTTGGTFSSTTGLNIDPTTGLITLSGNAGSLPGNYTVVYSVAPNNAICLAGGSATFDIVITPVITPVTTIAYQSQYCIGSATPLPDTSAPGFTTGGTFSSTAGLDINPTTGEVLSTSIPGTYTITYSITADPATCRVASSSTDQIVIGSPIQISVSGNCEGIEFVLTVSPTEGSFDSNVTYTWENSSGANVGSTQSIVVSALDTYTVTVTSNGCPNSSFIVVDAITCVIQKGISANNDGLNDSFDLRGFNVKKLGIFNRYGVKVYEQSNYTDQWKGQSDGGDELPDGTYYFVIERDNGETRTGWIYINRVQ
ncbi:fibronectin type III domain-containing protein [Flavobacterium sp. 102]|uniref:fibronectin type III domain-containing protein n=1 Tax=Flavobacterium sp. 102 TaxID=2135623 RepID=UPI000EAD9737|nr:fibronectin type III domain-containing protein [Flavobacterium sp. 102]RKS00900.1 gliding motility-associated-like protein [Flavobacterium sp. 102]